MLPKTMSDLQMHGKQAESVGLNKTMRSSKTHSNSLAILLVTFAFVVGTSGKAESQKNTKNCKEFMVSFDEALDSIPTDLYDGKRRIGTVKESRATSVPGHDLVICVNREYSSIIEHGIFFFINEDKIDLYRLWSTGTDADEGTIFHGHRKLYGIYVHEFLNIYEAAKRLVFSICK